MLAYLYRLAQESKLSIGLSKTFVPSTTAAIENTETNSASKLISAREELSRLEDGINLVNNEINNESRNKGNDFGPDASFYKLRDQCYSYESNQYRYSICPFQRASQEATSIGNYQGWGKKENGETDYHTMLFDHGTACWNGPNRSLKVTFECGLKDKVLEVDEPSKCTYAAKFSTPAVCDDRHLKELRLELDFEQD